MDSVIRAAAIYIILLTLFRLTGKRSLSEATSFDFVLILIIAEAVESALLDGDHSFTNVFLLILTLLGIDIALSLAKQRSLLLDKLVDDVPLILVDDGKVLTDRLKKSRIDENDILQAARQLQGLERMDQVKYAVLERSGGISIIPR
jgi:uncharacterized membrane protein YcaP (DUF421 family)